MLILAFDAEVTKLIQLYIVGVFVSFNLSQLGMIKHWNRHLRAETDPAERRRMKRSRAVNTIGLAMTATVLVIVLLTKFLAGAWIAIVGDDRVFLLMRGIGRHYDRVSDELAIDDTDVTLPSRVHAIVLVSKLHKPTMRALAYARVSRPNSLEALTVELDPAETAALMKQWDELAIPIPLKVVNSPYRELRASGHPVRQGAAQGRARATSSRSTSPSTSSGRWWEQLLHNQTALRLKGRLLFMPGVMVTSVPYQLSSAGRAKQKLAKRLASRAR